MSVTLTRPNGDTLTFDASPRQSWQPSVAITDHPIEDGSTVSDHAQIQPRRLAITGVVSETPLGEDGGPLRVEDAVRFLNEAGEGGELLTVETRLGSSTNWLLESWPHDVTVLRGLVFELSLKQVSIATAETITLPREVPRPRYSDTAPPETDVGTQPTQEASVAEEAQANRLAQYLRGERSVGLDLFTAISGD